MGKYTKKKGNSCHSFEGNDNYPGAETSDYVQGQAMVLRVEEEFSRSSV